MTMNGQLFCYFFATGGIFFLFVVQDDKSNKIIAAKKTGFFILHLY